MTNSQRPAVERAFKRWAQKKPEDVPPPSKVIAIDGPGGSGKSTLARRLARELGLFYIDTGAMYRALACYFSEEGTVVQESSAFERALEGLSMDYGPGAVAVEGRDFSAKIRHHSASAKASAISRLPCVRRWLVNFQRKLGEAQFCVMEGRDVGTVIFPRAWKKIFLTASLKQRARRRALELGLDASQVEQDLKTRDESDSTRDASPLKRAPDAKLIDTTALDEQQALALMKEYIFE